MAFTFSDLNKLNIDSLADVISLTLGLEGELSNGVTVLAGIEKGKPILTFTATDKAVRRSAGCDKKGAHVAPFYIWGLPAWTIGR